MNLAFLLICLVVSIDSNEHNPHNQSMVYQVLSKYKIISEKVKAVMLSIDRGDFVDKYPYLDQAISIGYSATISAPHMHAIALNYLEPCLKPGNKVLDIGSGSGYMLLAFSKMMEDKGIVIGIEHVKALVERSKMNIWRSNEHLIDSGIISIIEADGRKGYKPQEPYNCIHVGAAAENEIPDDLISQLANDGIMMIPAGKVNLNQAILLIRKDKNGNVSSKTTFPVAYVPLTSLENQLNKKTTIKREDL